MAVGEADLAIESRGSMRDRLFTLAFASALAVCVAMSVGCMRSGQKAQNGSKEEESETE